MASHVLHLIVCSEQSGRFPKSTSGEQSSAIQVRLGGNQSQPHWLWFCTSRFAARTRAVQNKSTVGRTTSNRRGTCPLSCRGYCDSDDTGYLLTKESERYVARLHLRQILAVLILAPQQGGFPQSPPPDMHRSSPARPAVFTSHAKPRARLNPRAHKKYDEPRRCVATRAALR